MAFSGFVIVVNLQIHQREKTARAPLLMPLLQLSLAPRLQQDDINNMPPIKIKTGSPVARQTKDFQSKFSSRITLYLA